MGFFKHVFKKESEEANPTPPPLPSMQAKGGDLSDIPPAPKPLDMSAPNAPRPSPQEELSEPNTDFSIPPLDSSFSENPMSENPFMQETGDVLSNTENEPKEEGKSFAEKFGTPPDPDIQTEVHEAHKDLQNEIPVAEEGNEKFSFGGEPTLDELDSVIPRETTSDKKIAPNELPLHEEVPVHEQIEKMIDEHVEEKIKEKEPVIENIPKEVHEETIVPPPSFHEEVKEEKNVQIPLSKNIDPNKPLFVRLEFCGELVRELNDIRSILKVREDDYSSFQNVEKQLNNNYDNWKGSLETIQSNLIKMDKMIFKD